MGLVTALLIFGMWGCTDKEEQLKIRRDIADLQEQIYQLERSQSELRTEVRGSMEGLNQKIEDRTAQANVQEQLHAVKEGLAQFQARVHDLDAKVSSLARTRSQVTLAPGEGTSETGNMTNVSGEVVEQQFNQATLDFNRGKYEVAILGFKDVISNFPNSPYSEAAHYYLGRSYFETRKYQEAGENYRTIVTRYPQGDYVKQALYYEGQCFYYLNQHSKAILTLRDLIEKFPGTQESDLARQFLKKAGYEK